MKKTIELLELHIKLLNDVINNEYITDSYKQELKDNIRHYKKAIKELEKIELKNEK